METVRPLVLVTNDDGYNAKGLQAIVRQLEAFADVIVVAPLVNQSAKSFSLSLEAPLAVQEYEDLRTPATRVFSVSGTPVDSVIVGMHQVLPSLGVKLPDLVISGINHGANLGGDILVSGTVSAAMYASMHYSIPSIAASVVFASATSQPVVPLHGPVKEVLHFEAAAVFVAKLAAVVLRAAPTCALLRDTVLNVNVPNSDPDKGRGPSSFAITCPGIINYVGDTLVQKTPGSNVFYLSGQPAYANIPGSDCVAVWHGIIAVTPLTVRLPGMPVQDDAVTLTNAPLGSQTLDPSPVIPVIAGSELGSSFTLVEPEAPEAPDGVMSPRTRLLSRSKPVRPTALVCPWSFQWAVDSLKAGDDSLGHFTVAPVGFQGTLEREFMEHVTSPLPATPARAPASAGSAPAHAVSSDSGIQLTLRGYSAEDGVSLAAALAPVSRPPPAGGGAGTRVGSVGLTLEGLCPVDVIRISAAVQQATRGLGVAVRVHATAPDSPRRDMAATDETLVVASPPGWNMKSLSNALFSPQGLFTIVAVGLLVGALAVGGRAGGREKAPLVLEFPAVPKARPQ